MGFCFLCKSVLLSWNIYPILGWVHTGTFACCIRVYHKALAIIPRHNTSFERLTRCCGGSPHVADAQQVHPLANDLVYIGKAPETRTTVSENGPRSASSSSLPPDPSHQVRIAAFAGSLWWAASALGLVLCFVEEG